MQSGKFGEIKDDIVRFSTELIEQLSIDYFNEDSITAEIKTNSLERNEIWMMKTTAFICSRFSYQY